MLRELRPLPAVILLCSLAACARTGQDVVPAPTAADASHVGFAVTTVDDGAGAPIELAVWYPTEARGTPQPLGGWTQVVAPDAPAARGRRPLVVMSHGSGGWYGGHHDTALALARAGFVVAALTHPGDNYRDGSRVTDVAARPRALRRVVDHMLDASPQRAAIDAARIGAFGFSNGGYTVLIAAGAVPDLTRFPAHCDANPTNDDCTIVRSGGAEAMAALATPRPDSVWAHDERIRAVVVAAPALGFAFTPDGLRGVTVPVQLWRAADDRVLPAPAYADAVRAALPAPPEYHDVAGAGHFDFLAPCDPGTAARVPEICASAPGFDRAAFHDRFNRDVVAFFDRTLRAGPDPSDARAQRAGAPAELLGTWVDDYGNRYTVTPDAWTQLPHGRFHVRRWDAAGGYLIARNDAANAHAPGRWTRIDWVELRDMAPWTWAFCLSAYDAATAAAAESTLVARRETPRTGCNGHPFSRMRPADDPARDQWR